MIITIVGVVITVIGLLVGLISLYLQKKSLRSQLAFQRDLNKTLVSTIKLQKKVIKELKNGRIPSETELKQKEEELRIKREKEKRLQFQAGWKVIRTIFSK